MTIACIEAYNIVSACCQTYHPERFEAQGGHTAHVVNSKQALLARQGNVERGLFYNFSIQP